MPYIHYMEPGHTVVETPSFLRDAAEAGLSDDDRARIVSAVASNPKEGDLIKETGGLRKRRFAGRGKGKSGGFRVIVAYTRDDRPAYLVALYGKGDQIDLSPAERKAASAFMRELKKT